MMLETLISLFFIFFKIGLFTFGGGYAMIPMIKEEMISRSWLSEGQIIQFIAISESTPGPFAINIATLVGSMHAGPLGAIVATLGVVTPSFLIILLVAVLFRNIGKNKYVQAALKGIRPVIVGLILSTGILLLLKNSFVSFPALDQGLDLPLAGMMVILATFMFFYRKTTKRTLHPIALIVFAAILGIIVYM